MDSWHFWSSDSHWLIFASKRGDTDMTCLYLTYIDENGIDHPPVKLKGYENLKINLPQFLPKNSNLNFGKELREFLTKLYQT